MATGGAVFSKKEEDFRINCNLCLEPYRGKSPKILPCFHTFCLPCLTSLQTYASKTQDKNGESQCDSSDNNGPDEESNMKKETSSGESDVVTGVERDVRNSLTLKGSVQFLCPTCRAPVSVPEGGVSALQTNFYLDLQSPPPADCDLCDDESKQQAAHACQQCDMRLCPACRRTHDKLTKDHRVTSLLFEVDEPVKLKSKVAKAGLCPQHQDQTLCFLCRQCDVSICLHCKLTSHEGHKTVDLTSVAVEAKEEVKSLINKGHQQLLVVQAFLRRLENAQQDMIRYKQQATQQVNARYDALLAEAMRSRDKVLEELTAKEDASQSQLRVTRLETNVIVETLSALVSRPAYVSDSVPDLMLLRNELQTTLLSDSSLDQYRQQADKQTLKQEWRYDVTRVLDVELKVLQTYMGQVVDGSGDDVARLLPTTELANKVDSLIKEMTDISAVIATITTQVTANTAQIASNSREIFSKFDHITTNKNSIDSNTRDIMNVKENITANANNIKIIKKEVAVNANNIAENKTKITKHDTWIRQLTNRP